MQKVQVLLQPTLIATHAAQSLARRAGSAEGNRCISSKNSACATPCSRARRSSTGRLCRLWVPNTTSTHGARSSTRPWSFCARQPPTAMVRPRRALVVAS
jgi:hypothetical protein